MISFKQILEIVSKLSTYLQYKELDYCKANIMVEETINQLCEMRENNSFWEDIWKKTEELSKVSGITSNDNLVSKRKKSLPAKFKDFFTELQAEDNWQEVEHELKVRCFYPILDRILNELRNRFGNNTRMNFADMIKMYYFFKYKFI